MTEEKTSVIESGRRNRMHHLLLGKLRIVFSPQSQVTLVQGSDTTANSAPTSAQPHSPLIVRLPTTRKRKQEEEEYVRSFQLRPNYKIPEQPQAKRIKSDREASRTPTINSREERIRGRVRSDSATSEDYAPKQKRRGPKAPKNQDFEFEPVATRKSGRNTGVGLVVKLPIKKQSADNEFVPEDNDLTPKSTRSRNRQPITEDRSQPESGLALQKRLLVRNFFFL
jgi:hypothetical protein